MANAAYHRAYRAKNLEKSRAYARKSYHKRLAEGTHKRWADENPEAQRESSLKSKAKHREKHKAYNKAWAKRNAGKVSAYARAYQASKINATPKWLSAQQVKDIEVIYEKRPAEHHVDHVIPLKGKNVCGLHVSWNLQYLPASENIRKSNK